MTLEKTCFCRSKMLCAFLDDALIKWVRRTSIISMLSCLSVFFGGCFVNSDDAEELSGNYFYRDEGTHVKDILCHLPGRKEIYSEVIGFDHNNDFIVVAQKPVYQEYRTAIGFNLRNDLKKYPTNSGEEIIRSEEEADSILKKDDFFRSVFAHDINYWIIDNKTDQVYGPFTKTEFEEKRKVLNVPGTLQIKYN